MHTLFDIGSNVTLLKRKLTKQLGPNVEVYTSTFWVALGATAHFVRQLSKIKLQLYDFFGVMVEGI